MKLTKPQKEHLLRIVNYSQRDAFEYAGYFDSTPERNLIKKGLIEYLKYEKCLGGGNAPINRAKVIWNLAKPTKAGKQEALKIMYGNYVGTSSRCSCGWLYFHGKPCCNPSTSKCSSKLMFGK